MELLSKEILDQIRAEKAERDAAKSESVPVDNDVDENYDPFRNIEIDVDREMDEATKKQRGLFLASW